MDPRTETIGGERLAGAPMFVRLPVSLMVGGTAGEVGPAVLFATAHGDAPGELARFRQGDAVRVAGRLRLARYDDGRGMRETFACEADSVEPDGLRH